MIINSISRVIFQINLDDLNKIEIIQKIFIFSMLLSNLLIYDIKTQEITLIIPNGHTRRVFSVNYSFDGSYIISSGGDRSVKLWSTALQKELRVYRGHTGRVLSSTFSTDGSLIVSGGEDNNIIIWNTETGEKIRILRGHSDAVTSLCISPDNKYIISVSKDFTLRIWSLTTGEMIKKIDAHTHSIWSVDISKNGMFLITGGADKIIKLWDMHTGRLIRTFKGHNNAITSVAFSPDGKYIVSGSVDKTVRLWETHNGIEKGIFRGHDDVVTSVKFTNDGLFFLSASLDKMIKMWSVTMLNKEIRTYRGHGDVITSLSVSERMNRFVSSSYDGLIIEWDLGSGFELNLYEGKLILQEDISVSTGNKYMVMGYNNGDISIWDLSVGRKFKNIIGHSQWSSSIEISSDNRYFASGSSGENIVKLWDIATGKNLNIYQGHTKPIVALAFSNDNEKLASGSWDKLIKIWDIKTGEIEHTLSGHQDRITHLKYSYTGDKIVSGSWDGSVIVWDTQNGDIICRLTGHTKSVTYVSFIPHKNQVVSTSIDGSIKVWDINEKREIFEIFDEPIFSADISIDGRQVVFGGPNGVIKIWDISNGKIENIGNHSDIVTSISYSPDGNFIISGGLDCLVQIWDTKNEMMNIKLVSIEDDWVVIGSDGRFDGTARGMESMYYVQGLEVLPIDSFFEYYHTPNLLARFLLGEQFPEAHPSIEFSEGVSLPPSVDIISPRAGETLTTDEAVIIVNVVDRGGGIDEVRLYQNGKLVSEARRGMVGVEFKVDKLQKSFNVVLLPGINEFKATAYNKERIESQSQIIRIKLDAQETTADLYVMALGLNEYKNSVLNLNYGRTDARSFVEAIGRKAEGIFRKLYLKELYDRDVTRESVHSVFEDIISRARPQDSFIFFYAGHGVMGEGNEDGLGDYFIVPYDVTQLYGNDRMLRQRGISATELREYSRQILAQKQLFMLDACQSGGMIDIFALRGIAEQKAIAQLARSTGTFVFAASGTEQYASEFKELGHGVFTYALLEGLRGAADKNPRDGTIMVTELMSYLNDVIPNLTRRYRGSVQYPVIYSYGQPFPIAVIP